MLDFIIIFLIALTIFLVLDGIWLGFIAKNMYKKKIGHLMAEKPRWLVAAVFYLFFITGLSFFVIQEAVNLESIIFAMGGGAFFGALTYSTYDLTNLATLKKWPVSMAVIDIIWGSFLSAAVAVLTYLVIMI